ncbi:UNVERIFIED_CONTAM: hypothetical protein Sindi_0995400 [Sesamum indicum]
MSSGMLPLPRGRGPPLPPILLDVFRVGEASSRPPIPLDTPTPFFAPQTPDDTGIFGAACMDADDALQQPATPAAAPPPSGPTPSARQYISLDDARRAGIFPHPLPCLRQGPPQHQHFWFESMKPGQATMAGRRGLAPAPGVLGQRGLPIGVLQEYGEPSGEPHGVFDYVLGVGLPQSACTRGSW